jgi:16S rRNA (cytosine967-C5)-methyltransferase
MPDAARLKAPGQLLPSNQNDGFFYALFEKIKT